MTSRFTMILDEEYEQKLAGYCLYRSSEKGDNNRPLIDGLYIQREQIEPIPPKCIELTLEI
ncbi:hypothetical protein ACFLWS_08245 [Chloroflexota bacterium]